MILTKVISTSANKLKQLIPKVLVRGRADVQEAIQASPYGVDSNPIKDMVAVYSRTENDGSVVIIGYLNKQSLAETGEYRTFSTDDSGEIKFYTWLKKDGTYEMGGDSNFAVKYNELATEFNKLKTDFNNHITEYNTHTHSVISVGSPSGTPITPSPIVNVSDITQAKNDKIKTIG